MWFQSLDWEDTLEEEIEIHSSILAWRTPWTVAREAPLPVEFSRQEYWSGLLFPLPEDLPNPATEPVSLESPVLAGRFFTTSA